MKRSSGFTLVEIIITVTVMVILLTLGFVGVRGTQAQARDEERKTDVENIARGLERRYTEGNPRATMPWEAKGTYPGINEMLHASWGSARSGFVPEQIVGGYLTDLLPGTTPESYMPPGATSRQLTYWCVYACPNYTTTLSSTMASVNNTTTTGTYVYSPVSRNGNVCYNGDCVKFFLYYRSEVDGQLKTIKSRNQ